MNDVEFEPTITTIERYITLESVENIYIYMEILYLFQKWLKFEREKSRCALPHRKAKSVENMENFSVLEFEPP